MVEKRGLTCIVGRMLPMIMVNLETQVESNVSHMNQMLRDKSRIEWQTCVEILPQDELFFHIKYIDRKALQSLYL